MTEHVVPAAATTSADSAASGPASISRRAGLQLGAAGLAGLGLAAAGGTAAQAAPAHARPRAGQRAVVRVAVSTMWTEPGLNRPLDKPALSVPVRPDDWNRAMQATEPRRWLTGKLESQALYGTEVIVDRISGTWAHILVPSQSTPRDKRGYPGWVPLSHLVRDEAFRSHRRHAATAQVTAKATTLTRGKGTDPCAPRTLSWNTMLPVRSVHGSTVTVDLPGGGTGTLARRHVEIHRHDQRAPRPTVEQYLATAQQFLGLRYLWAGMSSWGMDCSGFTHGVLLRHGIIIPRDAGPQLNNSGLKKIARKNLRRGDLVFFATKPGGTSIRHVAFYLGHDKILQAPNAARSVEIVSLTEYDPTGEYAGAVRVIGR